jgi:hypothetical protein
MADYQEILSETLQGLWVQSPLHFVWLVGILWAILTWKRHPRKSFLVTLVLILFLIEVLVWPFAFRFLFKQMVQGGTGNGMYDFQRLMTTLQFCHSLVHAGLWLVLFIALFVVDRQPAAPRGPDGELLPPELLRGKE